METGHDGSAQGVVFQIGPHHELFLSHPSEHIQLLKHVREGGQLPDGLFTLAYILGDQE